jgi:alkaline phosphatase
VNRGLSGEISAYAPKSGFSFFGAPVFKGMKGKDGSKTGWVESMKEAGYAVVRSFSSYSALSGDTDKVLMLASNPQGEQVGYTIDSIPGTLTAEEITRTALAQLYKEGKDNGFFLMMEGGNIDWASHANDGATVIREVMNFQKAIDVAYRFYLAHPDETLIVVTADHDTGGMALGRSGTKIPDLSLVDFQRISKDRFSDYCKSLIAGGGEPSWDSMKTFLTENTGLWGAVALTDEETARLRDSFEAAMLSRKSADEKGLYNSFNRFSVDVFDVINSKYGIGWTTGSHTGNPVPLFAVGRDAMLFTKALDNTEIPQLILKAAGIDSFSR